MSRSDLSPVVIPRSQQRQMLSARTGRSYDIAVAWPQQDTPDSGIPVVYVVDGNALFTTFVESIRSRSGRPESTGVVPAIVVGVSPTAGSSSNRDQRRFEFTSAAPAQNSDEFQVDESGGVYGGASEFLHFVCEDVRSMIEREFSVNRSRQTLAGHSLGGLFVLEAMLQKPDLFNSYVVMSPSVWWDGHRLLSSAHALETGSFSAQVCLSVGEYEEEPAPWQRNRSAQDLARFAERRGERAMIGNTREVAAALTRASKNGERVTFDLVLGEDHASMVPVAAGRALRHILAPD